MVKFEMHLKEPVLGADPDAKAKWLEYIRVDTGGKDYLHRQATDADKSKYAAEYAEFLKNKKSETKTEAKAEEPEADEEESDADESTPAHHRAKRSHHVKK